MRVEVSRVVSNGRLQMVCHLCRGLGQLTRGRRVAAQESLRQPHTSHLQRHCGQIRIPRSISCDQLGGSAADVEDEEGPIVQVEVGHRPRQR